MSADRRSRTSLHIFALSAIVSWLGALCRRKGSALLSPMQGSAKRGTFSGLISTPFDQMSTVIASNISPILKRDTSAN